MGTMEESAPSDREEARALGPFRALNADGSL